MNASISGNRSGSLVVLRRLRTACCAAALSVLWASCLQATEITWTNEAGGDFQTAGNWSPNTVPGTNDLAIFDLTTGPYTVTWSASITNHSVKMLEGTSVWDLAGYAYSLNLHSTNRVGSDTTTADLTITNGIVSRPSPGYVGSQLFRLSGAGTTLRLLAGGQYNGAPYPYLRVGTHLIIDGAGAQFGSAGYSKECQGSIVVTNGGFLSVGDGMTIQSGSDVRISGPGYSANGLRNIEAGSVVRFDNDAEVRTAYGSSPPGHTILFTGPLTLDDARFYYYTSLGTLLLSDTDAILEGDGEVEFKFMNNAGGSIRPGGTNNAGLLACLGNFTNSTGTGSIDIELGGTGAGEFDRLTFASGAGGAGTFWAGGDLNITLINGFTLTDNDTFDILDFVTAVGTFDNVNVPDNAIWDWDLSALYTSGEITYSVITVMPAPTGVAASDGAFETKVALTWDTTGPATGYEVWRNLSNDTATATHVGGVSGTAYDDTTTTIGQTNWYWIKATNATLVSAFSNPDSGWKVAALPVPGIPANVSASDGVYVYQGKVVVTWDAAADATGYEVWTNSVANSGTATLVGTPSGTTYDHITAAVEVTNYYWVKATNPAHTSDFSSYDTGWMAPVPPYEIVWTNAAGGSFQTAGNWDPGYVPGTNNRAVFSLTSTPYVVTWSASVTNEAFKVEAGTVTWNLQGHEYTVDHNWDVKNPLVFPSSLGTDTTTADLTVTNGTLRNLNNSFSGRVHIRGTNTILRILEADALGLCYPWVYGPSKILVDGPNASLTTAGYSWFYGEVVVTNGAWISAGAGTQMRGNGSLTVMASASTHAISPSVFDQDATIYLGPDALVNESYVHVLYQTPVKGRMILDGARYTGGYASSRFGLIETNAVLEGSGLLRFASVVNYLGTIWPGGANNAGLLVTEGISNAVAGTIGIELGGTETNDYDRLFAVDGFRGDGDFHAGGTLTVTLINGFKPEETTFDILDFVTMEGVFDTLDLPAIPGGTWLTNNLYVTGEITYLPPPKSMIVIIR